MNTNLSITNWWLIYHVSMATLYFLTNNYLFKINNRNTRTWCETCLKLTIKTPCSSVSVVEQVSIGGVISFKQIELYVWWRSDYWSTLKSCKVGVSVFGWFLVIPPSAGWFWAISDYFMIYTIYMIYFFQLYSYHLKAFSSR